MVHADSGPFAAYIQQPLKLETDIRHTAHAPTTAIAIRTSLQTPRHLHCPTYRGYNAPALQVRRNGTVVGIEV